MHNMTLILEACRHHRLNRNLQADGGVSPVVQPASVHAAPGVISEPPSPATQQTHRPRRRARGGRAVRRRRGSNDTAASQPGQVRNLAEPTSGPRHQTLWSRLYCGMRVIKDPAHSANPSVPVSMPALRRPATAARRPRSEPLVSRRPRPPALSHPLRHPRSGIVRRRGVDVDSCAPGGGGTREYGSRSRCALPQLSCMRVQHLLLAIIWRSNPTEPSPATRSLTGQVNRANGTWKRLVGGAGSELVAAYYNCLTLSERRPTFPCCSELGAWIVNPYDLLLRCA